MKAKKAAVFFTAAFALLAGAPLLRPAAAVCAADTETQAVLPDWVPADFESAAAHREQNILIQDDLLCIVSTEYKEADAYSFSYSEDRFETVSSARYEGSSNQVSFRVDVLKAAVPGIAQVLHTDLSLDQLTQMYAFSIDAELAVSEISLPKWFPTYFDSALSFYNRYGKTHIRDGVLCTVFHETVSEHSGGSPDEADMLSYSDDLLRCLCSVRFTEGSDCLLVSLFEPAAPGAAKLTYANPLYYEVPYEYTFAIDEKRNIKETDIFAWLPDCSSEFRTRKEINGAVLTHGGDIAFLLETTGGTGYSWKEAVNEPALAEFAAVSDCTELKIYRDGQRPTGGSVLEARIYRAGEDGQFTLRLDLMPPGRDAEAADSLGGVMQIVGQAGMVLLPGEARVTLIHADTGREVLYPFDHNGSFYIDYLIGEENNDPTDPETWNPYQFLELKSAVSKQPLGSLFANEKYSLRMSTASMPQGYFGDAVYADGVCSSGDAVTVKRYTDDIADITVKVQFSAEGDINDDGAFSIADAVVLQRWLLCTLDTAPANWKAGDFVNDDRLDARDLTVMKRRLLERAAAVAENGLLFTLHTIYGGYGVAGQDLGHGSYDTEYCVIEGDAFYETYDGQWIQNIRWSGSPILTVEKIGEDTVTVSVKGRDGLRQEAVLNIGEPVAGIVRSDHVVFDGINYSYELRFDRIPAAADAGAGQDPAAD